MKKFTTILLSGLLFSLSISSVGAYSEVQVIDAVSSIKVGNSTIFTLSDGSEFIATREDVTPAKRDVISNGVDFIHTGGRSQYPMSSSSYEEKVWGRTSAYNVSDNKAAYHYTRAKFEDKNGNTYSTYDSGRKWDTGSSYAETDRLYRFDGDKINVKARSYFGN